MGGFAPCADLANRGTQPRSRSCAVVCSLKRTRERHSGGMSNGSGFDLLRAIQEKVETGELD